MFKVKYLLFMLPLIWSCKSSQTSTTPAVKKSTLSESQRADVTHVFFNANKEKILGNLNNAASLFAEVIRKDPSNAAAMYELANIYVEQKKYADALYFAKTAWQIDSKNIWYSLSYADILEKNRKFDEAANVLNQLVKDYPERIDFYYEHASALIYAEKLNEAIKVYDKVEEKSGISKEVSLQKARLYQRLNKNDKAIAELQKLIDSNPSDAQSYGMLAEMYQSMGEKQKALDTYNKILKVDPNNPYIHLSLADFYRSNGEKEKSVEQLKLAFANKELDIETKISILVSYYALIELHPELRDQAMDMVQLLVESHPSEPRAFAVQGDFLSQDNKPMEALAAYRKAKDLGSKDFLVYSRILYLESQVEDWDNMLKDGEETISLFPDQPLAYFFTGLAHMQKKSYAEAVTVLNRGVKMVVDNASLEEQFFASLGDGYQELKDFKKSEENYEKALEINPNNANVLNNYAYYLSLRGEKLMKAEEMSKLSNELEPEQPSYQDTYGWVMFKMGKYKEAEKWIAMSLKNSKDSSATVLEHYGDVLYKIGDTSKAMEYWQKARQAGDGASEFLERKILEKTYLE
ncbi:MAG: tetratricopeptide repeat protein [Bacteroidetes bacterium]|nr:MAG: tetratricopeptide repeat protein [Bacteroidota bacterium]REK04687.1 MAG: tetratricopeptide repeat protein [Bacteroidota bacterium]REK51467.1 MAG: tetratricopeptide repeat protein [Bacteroidota bacterium]